jgi:hypothetical protein
METMTQRSSVVIVVKSFMSIFRPASRARVTLAALSIDKRVGNLNLMRVLDSSSKASSF